LPILQVKGVSFFGEDDEYICSGSDCGHVFLWDKARGNVVWWEEADTEVVNCLEPHPRLPLFLATSGGHDWQSCHALPLLTGVAMTVAGSDLDFTTYTSPPAVPHNA
jgi:WD repeat-containing protein 42A